MRRGLVATAALTAVGVAGVVLASQNQIITGPEADYWVSASTTSGLAGMMGAGGGRPSMSQMLSMGLSGGPPAGGAHSLNLQLGSKASASGPPHADHLPPPGLNGGSPLPLLTPQAPPPAPHEEGGERVQRFREQKPDGRMLIFWGCGEHAPNGQPISLEFSHMTDPGYAERFGQAMRGMPVSPQTPPSPANWTTYGEWPNARSGGPPQGSLVGPHQVRGNYSPDIEFSLGPDQDFMGPIALDSRNRSPSGSVELRWGDVMGARAFTATVMGAGDDKTMVIWTSSQAGPGGLSAPAYLSNGDIHRLVADHWLLPAEARACQVPAEVVQALGKGGMTTMVAYGGEANFAYPPRPVDPKTPWHIKWETKVRYRSSTMGMLGQGEFGRDRTPPRPRPGLPIPGLPGLPGVPHF